MKRLLPLACLALVACGGGEQEQPRGLGVYDENPQKYAARQQAEVERLQDLPLSAWRARLIQMGITEAEIATVPDPDYDLQRLELRLAPARVRQLDTAALAALVLDSGFLITFADPKTERAVELGEAIYRREREKAIGELAAHQDLARVPRRGEGESLTSLARRIEHWCDYEPGGALEVIDGEWLQYTTAPVSNVVAEPQPGRETARFDCLRRAVFATQLRRYFIGYRGEPPPPIY